MQKDDSQIIKEYLDGEEKSFSIIVERYANSVYNFIFRLSGNREESDDLTQEVFLKVWKNLKKFDQEKNFKTWVFSIARNTVIDWMRKKKSYTFSQLETEDEDRFEDTLPDLGLLPDEIFERKQLAEELESALENIPADYKAIILLHLAEDLTFEEIAEAVGKPMNTVKSQYRRALLMLRKHLSR